MWIVLIIAFLVLVILFHLVIYHKYNFPSYTRAINKIPGPPGVFYFGNSIKFHSLKHEELLYYVVDGFEKWGPTYRLWLSGVPTIFISELDDIQTILSSRQTNGKGVMYKHIRPWLGDGLLTSSGQKWMKMRKIITPTFHFSILHDYISVFTKNANIMMKILDKEANKNSCHLAKFVTHCALDNVCETAMGTSVNALGAGSDSPYVQAIFRIGQIIVKRIFSPILYTETSFALSPYGWEHSKLLKILHGFTSKIIQERRMFKELQKNTTITVVKDEDDSVVANKKKPSFLDILLDGEESHSLSLQAIREEVDTFMFEGHDTTAASITWSLFELGHNPDIQEQCFQELKKIFGDSDRSPTHRDLVEMVLLKRVIKEALRLYPSVPAISRKFTEEMQLSKYTIPANTEIILILYAIHRNPEVYPEPDKFDPDRFLPEAVSSRHPFAYIPFSAGQRNCIGQKFAMLEELVVLSSIIRNFKILSLNDRKSIKVVPEMILRPHENLLFKLTKRNEAKSYFP